MGELFPTLLICLCTQKVTGTCRNCQLSEAGSFALFDDAFRRRRLDGSINSRPSLFTRELDALTSDMCICPVGVLPGEKEGPTPGAFQAVFNERVKEKKAEGMFLQGSASVDNVMEGEAVECNADVQEFTATVFVDVSLHADDLTEAQKASLESIFKDTYNSLAFYSCDDQFRTVANVSLGTSDVTLLRNRKLQEETELDETEFLDVNYTFPNETQHNTTANATLEEANRRTATTSVFTGMFKTCHIILNQLHVSGLLLMGIILCFANKFQSLVLVGIVSYQKQAVLVYSMMHFVADVVSVRTAWILNKLHLFPGICCRAQLTMRFVSVPSVFFQEKQKGPLPNLSKLYSITGWKKSKKKKELFSLI